jgi:hypothetical protein
MQMIYDKGDVVRIVDLFNNKSGIFNSQKTPLFIQNYILSCPRVNLNNKYLLHRFKGSMEDAQACYRPQRGQRSEDRHKECPSLWVHFSWGCFIICKIMVPFHDLWIDGGETEKRLPYPQHIIEPAKIVECISETRQYEIPYKTIGCYSYLKHKDI